METVAQRVYMDLSDSEYMVELDAAYPEIMQALRYLREKYPSVNEIKSNSTLTGHLPLAEKLILSIEGQGFESQAGYLVNFQSWQSLKELIRSHYPSAVTEETFEKIPE